MKKPKAPEPRLIREDFLPEQEPMRNYRIKKITYPGGKVCYYPQKKFLWFWITLESRSGNGYGSKSWAHSRIFLDYKKQQKEKIEYLPVDEAKTVPPNPNPPPTVP